MKQSVKILRKLHAQSIMGIQKLELAGQILWDDPQKGVVL